jgi:nucleobase:cation symporter-1, NCS1 family
LKYPGMQHFRTCGRTNSTTTCAGSNRPARFFAAASFALAALGVNISANSLSAANDFMALFPRFVNLRRGQLLCAILCWALVPWKILESAGSFLNFMSAYAIFLGPIAAIMLFDFWIVHKRRYDTLALYDPHSIYRYRGGVNWRAIVAFLVGVAPSLPGFINGINPAINVGVGVHPYQIGWMIGFVGTAVVYTSLSLLLPAKETFIDRAVRPDEIYAAQAEYINEESFSPGDGSGSGEYKAGDPEKTGLRSRLGKLL